MADIEAEFAKALQRIQVLEGIRVNLRAALMQGYRQQAELRRENTKLKDQLELMQIEAEEAEEYRSMEAANGTL
jgi:hypothetical protein